MSAGILSSGREAAAGVAEGGMNGDAHSIWTY